MITPIMHVIAVKRNGIINMGIRIYGPALSNFSWQKIFAIIFM